MIRRIVRVLLLTLAGLGLLACGLHVAQSGTPPVPEPAPQTLRIATLNVHWIALRQSEGPWSPAGWEARRGPMLRAIGAIGPDILALQEAESFPGSNEDGTNLVVDALREGLPDMAVGATGDPRQFPPTQPILYARDRLELTDQGWFFFSETPDVIYSRTFDGGWAAFASWAEFRPVGGGAAFRVVNVHTDYSSGSNRLRSAELIRDRVAPWVEGGMPTFVVGDFNAISGARTMDLIAEAGVTFLDTPGATFHLNRGLNLLPAIDHIGHSAGLRPVTAAMVFRERTGEVWPSDHYPVFADFAVPAD